MELADYMPPEDHLKRHKIKYVILFFVVWILSGFLLNIVVDLEQGYLVLAIPALVFALVNYLTLLVLINYILKLKSNLKQEKPSGDIMSIVIDILVITPLLFISIKYLYDLIQAASIGSVVILIWALLILNISVVFEIEKFIKVIQWTILMTLVISFLTAAFSGSLSTSEEFIGNLETLFTGSSIFFVYIACFLLIALILNFILYRIPDLWIIIRKLLKQR